MSKLVKSGSFFDFPSGNIVEGTFSSQHKCRKHQKIYVSTFYTFLKNTDIEYIEALSTADFSAVLFLLHS